MPKGVALPSIQQALAPSTALTERLLASPPAPTRIRRWKCPSAKACRYSPSRAKVVSLSTFSGCFLLALLLDPLRRRRFAGVAAGGSASERFAGTSASFPCPARVAASSAVFSSSVTAFPGTASRPPSKSNPIWFRFLDVPRQDAEIQGFFGPPEGLVFSQELDFRPLLRPSPRLLTPCHDST